MSFSADFIEKVRDASDVSEVIGQDTELRPSGGGGTQLMGRCPFPDHTEKTPSFSVNSAKQVYHCFGCKKGGNIYHYLRDMRGLSFPEAVEYLANRAGIPIPKDQAFKEETDEKKKWYKEAHRASEIAAKFYHKTLQKLSDSHPAKAYLHNRGFTNEIIDTFELGFAPDEWESLRTHLVHENVSLKLAENIGLLKQRNSGNGHFDLFRGRIMFPIVSHKDSYVGFGGRVIKKDDQPKYLNSPDSDIFHKGSLFYGLNLAAKYIRSKDYVIVVEGYTDLIALHAAGIQAVVATLGTAMTDKHARLIKRYTKNVYVLFDGDSAGQKAAVRSLQILLEQGLFPKGLTLPGGNDPDEYIRSEGADSLKKLLQKAPDLFDWVLRLWTENYSGSPSDKVKLMDRLTPILQSIPDRRLFELYVQVVASRLGENPKWVWRSVKSTSGGQGPALAEKVPVDENPYENQSFMTPGTPLQDEVIDVKKASAVELELINGCLLNESALKHVLDTEGEKILIDPGAQLAFSLLVDRYRQMPNKFDSLTAYLQTKVVPTEHVARHLKKPLSELSPEGAKKLVMDCVNRLKADNLRRKQRELANQLQSQGDLSTRENLEQIMNIHRNRHSILKDNGSSEVE